MPDTAMAQALARLQASRTRLRHRLSQWPEGDDADLGDDLGDNLGDDGLEDDDLGEDGLAAPDADDFRATAAALRRSAQARDRARATARARAAWCADQADAAETVWPAEPVLGPLRDALRWWWAGQPLQAEARLVGGLARVALQPLALRHPLLLVGAAALLGAAAAGGLALAKPWRWPGVRQGAAVLGPQLVRRLLARR